MNKKFRNFIKKKGFTYIAHRVISQNKNELLINKRDMHFTMEYDVSNMDDMISSDIEFNHWIKLVDNSILASSEWISSIKSIKNDMIKEFILNRK